MEGKESTLCSEVASSALVASSNAKMAGFFRSALAIANLCLCPPERLNLPTEKGLFVCYQSTSRNVSLGVSKPWGIPHTKSQFASSAATSISSLEAASFP